MQEKAELAIVKQIQTICSGLIQSNSAITAYPHLSNMLYSMAHDLRALAEQIVATNREELFSGNSPTAILYKHMYKRELKIPSGVLGKGGYPSNGDVQAMLDYAIKHRGFPASDFKTSRDGQLIKIDPEHNSANISWVGNDMMVHLDNFTHYAAKVYSPLFHSPYSENLDQVFHRENIINPLLNALVQEESLYSKDTAVKHILHTHYHGTFEEPKEVPEDHLIRQVYRLLAKRSAETWGFAWVNVSWKDYVIEFTASDDYNVPGGELVTMSVCQPATESQGRHKAVERWQNNILLTNDLLTDTPKLLVLAANQLMDDPSTNAGQP